MVATLTRQAFADATRALAAALPGDAVVTVAKGCHDGVFWQRQAPPSCASSPPPSAADPPVPDGTPAR